MFLLDSLMLIQCQKNTASQGDAFYWSTSLSLREAQETVASPSKMSVSSLAHSISSYTLRKSEQSRAALRELCHIPAGLC